MPGAAEQAVAVWVLLDPDDDARAPVAFSCRDARCAYAGSTAEGDTCLVSAECESGAYCSSQLECAPIETVRMPPHTIIRIEGGMITASTAETAVMATEKLSS